ncbi:hypothetical protein ISS86_00190 [Candidatus Microgenomates bacterium]|nr:hypothetical protein [Candidatus Microgenomates bacterium]
MNHQPTPLDMATDLRRCIYASFSRKGFDDPNVKTFFNHALMIFRKLEGTLDKQTFTAINKQLTKAQNPNSNHQKRREDLLMATVLL